MGDFCYSIPWSSSTEVTVFLHVAFLGETCTNSYSFPRAKIFLGDVHIFFFIQVAVGSDKWLSVFLRLIYICMCAFVSMSAPRVCVEEGVAYTGQRGLGFPGAGVLGGCELPDRCWELSSGPHKYEIIPLSFYSALMQSLPSPPSSILTQIHFYSVSLQKNLNTA